jgi:hypothetical protein
MRKTGYYETIKYRQMLMRLGGEYKDGRGRRTRHSKAHYMHITGKPTTKTMGVYTAKYCHVRKWEVYV